MSDSPRLRRRIERDFPQPGSAPGIVAALDRLAETYPEYEVFRTERLRAAVVLLADGDLARFRIALELARTDYRDLLVAAELAHADWPARLDAELGPLAPD